MSKLTYIYIAGLEHSGTTLLSQLLSSRPGVLALGEVAQFFSAPHMKQYLARWGGFDDVHRCSCGLKWADCGFWSKLMAWNGKFGPDQLAHGYLKLLELLINSGEPCLVVDSSKTLENRQAVFEAWQTLDLPSENLLTIGLAKDPRGFAYSIGRKKSYSPSILSYWRNMNWWSAVYASHLTTFVAQSAPVKLLTYEQLCREPEAVLDQIGKRLGLDFTSRADVSHRNSHIALGNKDFIERNRGAIEYDAAWMKDRRVNIAYTLNPRARTLNRRVINLARMHSYAS
jgi:hypothetical protein